MAYATRKRKRDEANLVVAIDIGTTYSGASFQIFAQEDKMPIHEVVKWPNQVVGSAKIPSTIYYDSSGKPMLFGAETEDEDAIYLAETNGWHRVEWWKLELCPEEIRPNDLEISLPSGVTIDQVFKDQFVFIKANVQKYISNAYSDRVDFWNDSTSHVDVVLTTPNGWLGAPQQRIRQAAIAAGLVPPEDSDRITFVSEGEAALHFCMAFKPLKELVKLGDTVVICDAGGGTIDVCAYVIKSLDPLCVEEECRPQCLVGGGSVVTKVAREAIKTHLEGSAWDDPHCLSTAMRSFEDKLKRKFTGENLDSKFLLPLGGAPVDDQKYNVCAGRLSLLNEEIKEFFTPSLRVMVDGLDNAISDSSAKLVFLVGGLAESAYVLTFLQDWAKKRGVRIAKPDGAMAKAIANGALHRYQRPAVRLHIAPMHIGTETDVLFDSETMAGRVPFLNILGESRVRGRYYPIIKKGDGLRTGSEKIAEFHRLFGEEDSLDVEMELVGYRDEEPPDFYMAPNLTETLAEGFTLLGVVRANLKAVFDPLPWQTTLTSKKRFKKLTYEICLVFNGAELRAFLRWRQNRKSMTSNATVIYYQ